MRNRFLYLMICMWYLLMANTTFAYTRQDTLRGSNGSGRNWWDVQHYSLSVNFNDTDKTIRGANFITFKIIKKPADLFQIDLQDSLVITGVRLIIPDEPIDPTNPPPDNDIPLPFTKEGNAWFVNYPFHNWKVDSTYTIKVLYQGRPRLAKLPPWDGGFIWTKDSVGKPWISVACQGLGASSWWPCKDAQWDEPKYGMDIYIDAPKRYKVVVSNGKNVEETIGRHQTSMTHWQVKNPINTYNATFYIGDYAGWTDTLMGEKGKLDLSFYALRYNEEKAKKHFAVVKQMLHCFEYWMGPYPFYEDGYKLVEAPFLGMEHQSAVAYGNEYKMGYRGIDRSGTGVGELFDFIIIHESGHEWYGNNITAGDIADNWIHEGFTTYTEALFAECAAGREKAFTYTRGEWHNIRNDRPVIGDYGVNDDGSSDKYDKGSAVVHMIRVMMNNDEKFRQMLRKMNEVYYHKTVTSAEIENFIIDYTGLPLKPFFDQYLRTRDIPEIEWYVKDKKLNYRFSNTVEGFSLPLTVYGRKKTNIYPTGQWQSIPWKKGGYNIRFSEDFLVKPKS